MKKLLLIGTGGTIASRETGDGLSPGLQAEEIVSFVPEVRNLCEIEVLQLCNIDSTNMNPKIWRELVQAIKENFDRYDGFVVLHGTDTMAYTSAVLSYMIQHSRKPIVVTGSQKPIDRISRCLPEYRTEESSAIYPIFRKGSRSDSLRKSVIPSVCSN